MTGARIAVIRGLGRHERAHWVGAKWLAAASMSFLMLAGCGDDSPVAGPSPAASPSGLTETDAGHSGPDTTAACAAAETIARLDDESQGAINDVMAAVSAHKDPAAAEKEFEEGMRSVKKVLGDKTPEIVAAYDRLEGGVPTPLKDDVATVRDFTVRLADVISRLETVDDYSRLADRMAELGAVEAGRATLAVDRFTRDECGVTLAD